jgi:dCTP deaminase
MSILTGESIKRAIADGSVVVEPFHPDRVQPNSIDLTLGDEVRIYRDVTDFSSNFLGGDSYDTSCCIRPRNDRHCTNALDSKVDNVSTLFQIDESGWLIVPGVLYLMHTAEIVSSNRYVTQLNGKSSLARLGVIIHFTAGYGDTGFRGQYTLEVSGQHPVRLYAGMKIAQAVFYTTEGDVTQYAGNYAGKTALGAQPSRSWKQF